MLLTHQLIVLLSRSERCGALLWAVARVPGAFGVVLRDGAILTRGSDGRVVASDPGDRWPGRQELGHEWWRGLAEAVAEPRGPSARTLVADGVSRSFLEELTGALPAGSAAVAMAGDLVDLRLLTSEVDPRTFGPVIYGSLPDTGHRRPRRAANPARVTPARRGTSTLTA